MKRLFMLEAAMSLWLLSTSGFASSIGSGTLQYVKESGVGEFGFSVGPQHLKFNGKVIDLVCDDFTSRIKLGETWDVDLFNLFDSTLSTDAKFDTGTDGSLTTLEDYEAAAWLAQQISQDFGHVSKAQIGDLQFALWAIFSAKAMSNQGFDAQAQAYYQAATSMAANGDFSPQEFHNFVIYTPEPHNSAQEFVGFVATPEPATLGLLGLGIAVLGGKLRRRRSGHQRRNHQGVGHVPAAER